MEGWSGRFCGSCGRKRGTDTRIRSSPPRANKGTGRGRQRGIAAEVFEQGYTAGRLLVFQGIKIAKLPPTEGNRTAMGAVAMIRNGHQLSIDCINGARPKLSGGSTVDEYEFIPLTRPEKKGTGNDPAPMINKRKLRFPVLPSQLRFLESTARNKGFSGPVGSGKTYALCCQVLRSAAHNPGCTGLLGAPTYPMLKDATLPTLLDLLGAHSIAHKYLKSENVLMLTQSRSRILLRSLDRYENLRGTNLAWVGIDELTYCNREAWRRLEARVRDPWARRHRMFAVWTPKKVMTGSISDSSRPWTSYRTMKRFLPRPAKTMSCCQKGRISTNSWNPPTTPCSIARRRWASISIRSPGASITAGRKTMRMEP